MAIVMTELHISERQFRQDMSPFAIFSCLTFWEIRNRVDSDERPQRQQQQRRPSTIIDSETGKPIVWDANRPPAVGIRPEFDPLKLEI